MLILPLVLVTFGTLCPAKPIVNGSDEVTLTVGIPITRTSFHHFPIPTHGPHPLPTSHIFLPDFTATDGVETRPNTATASNTATPAVGARDETSGGQGLDAYQTMVLNSHNIHRVNHTAPALTWGDALAVAAKVLSDTCIFHHNVQINGGGYGQNILAGTNPSQIDEAITNSFYNGEFAAYAPFFGQSNPDMTNFDQWGHLTQLLWNESSEVGCYTTTCSPAIIDGRTGKPLEHINPYYTVCNYAAEGNVGGEYDRVHKPVGLPAVTAP